MLTRYYTIQDVAKMLDRSRRSVYRDIDSGKLRARKIGREWRISQEDYDAFVNGEQSTKGASFESLLAAVNEARPQLTTDQRMRLLSAVVGQGSAQAE